MEFNLISKQIIYYRGVRSLKRYKPGPATRTANLDYYPTLDPVIDKKPEATVKEEDEATDKKDDEATDKKEDEASDEEEDEASDEDEATATDYGFLPQPIDFLFYRDDWDLAMNLKERLRAKVPFITELTLTSSYEGRLKIYIKLEKPEDEEGDLFELLFKLQESLPPNSLGLILSVKDFKSIVGDDRYDYGEKLDFIEKGLKLKRNQAGTVILEMTDIHFPEHGNWWLKWTNPWADFRGKLSLNVRLDLAAVTELYKRKFKGGPLATEVVTTATDLVILVEGNKDKESGIKCHKSVLFGINHVFASMLRANMLEAKEGTLEVLDLSEAGIRALIEFAYRRNMAEALKSFGITLELLKAADRYEMKDLMNVLVHIILFMPCAWFEVDLAINLFIFAKNTNLYQAYEKARIVLKWYAKRDPVKLMNSKMWADMCESPRLAMKFVVQLLKRRRKHFIGGAEKV